MYCTTEQLITWFSEQELIQRTDREPFTGAIGQTVLDEAISAASRLVDGYLRSVYPLPLADEVVASSPLPEICGDIVRYTLYKGITNEEVAARYKDAIAWLRDVQAKRVTLGAADETVAEIGSVTIAQSVSRVDWDSY